MDLLEVLGISPPAADSALCLEIYDDRHTQGASDENLEALCEQCMHLLSPHTEGYIWQHEPLRLQSSSRQLPPWLLKKRGKHSTQQQQQRQQQQLPFLWGVLRYEDHVEDEWWAVWLLLQLSRQLPHLCVRLWDDDGEFLLIEAAYALPRWLKPETSTNRVWLRGGQLHIIPPPSKAAPLLPPAPSIVDAVGILSSSNYETHNARVEAPILARLAGYPQRAAQQQQRTTAWLPRRVGLLLQADPQIVSAAVEAFVGRQREDVQAAAKLANFAPTDMTTALVTLNRCMYAQLMGADFAPPKAYPAAPGGAWLGGNAARQDKAHSMGLKLVTGFEIMALRLGLNGASSSSNVTSDTGGLANGGSSSSGVGADQSGVSAAGVDTQQQQQQQQRAAPAPPLTANPAWRQYLASLTQSSYFEGEIEGSARYRQLMAAATAAFTASPAYEASCAAAAAPARHLQALLASIDAQQQQQQGDLPSGAVGAAADGTNGNAEVRPAHAAPAAAAAAVLDADGLQEDSDDWLATEPERAQQQLEAVEAQMAALEASKQQKQQARKAAAAGGPGGPAAAAAGGPGGPAAAAAGGPGGPAAAAGGGAAGSEVDAEQLVAGFKGFVQHLGSYEGAEVPAAAAAAVGGSSSGQHAAAGAAPKQKQRRGGAAAAAVDFSAGAFLQELMGVMGAAAAAPGQLGSSSSKGQQQQQQQAPEADALLAQLQSLQQQLAQCIQADDSGAAAAGAAAALRGLQSQPAAAAAAAVGGADDDDDYDSSSSEGSSFYGSDDEDEGSGDEDDGLTQQGSGFGQLPVPPPSSGPKQQQQWKLPPSFQAAAKPAGKSLQESWEVETATDSDDADTDEIEEDALSMGGLEEDEEAGSRSEDGSSSGSESGAAAGVGSSSSTELQDSAAAGIARGSRKAGLKAGLFDAYTSALDAELAATTMAQSFERVQLQDQQQQQGSGAHRSSQAGPGSKAAGAAAACGTTAAAGSSGGAGSAELAPLDVDMNLIKSLVASYTAQGGMPGPASNLAGLLGLQLPTEVLEEK